MAKRLLVMLMAVVWVSGLAGCATSRLQKEQEMESQALKNKISLLEAELQSRDRRIEALREELSAADARKEEALRQARRKKPALEAKSRPKVKDIQAALVNAGYNPGRIDGKMGRQTRDAIRAFQRANDLPADGAVGKRTWTLLREYLEKRVK